MIPVKLADTDDAPSAVPGVGIEGKAATCGKCGKCEAAGFQAGKTKAFTGREAIRGLARACEESGHTHYHDTLPANVRLEYIHRGRRLPCYRLGTGRTLVGIGGAIAKGVQVFVVADVGPAQESAEKLAKCLGDRITKPHKITRHRRTIRGYKVSVELAAAEARA